MFNSYGRRVGHRTNAGTYNNESPIHNLTGHVVDDVISYILFGNGPSMIDDNCGCLSMSLRGRYTF